MADLAVITPTRGRPERFTEMVDATLATASLDVQIWVGLDNDDESADALVDLHRTAPIFTFCARRRSLSAWTNFLAEQALAGPDPPRYLASLGDDHRPRTKGWDRKLIQAVEDMDGPGFAYGNDLYQGPNLPTAWVVSAEVVRAVGWMMLPACAHLYVDTAVLALGAAAGRITYRSDVVIEHLHPYAGKARMDDSYRESNSPERFAADRHAFEAWKRNGLADDAAKIRALTGVPR